MEQKLSTETTWFHIFKELIRSQRWRELSPSAAKLYPVIKACINWETGTAFPSITTLEEYSGLSRATVVKSLSELVNAGILEKNNNRVGKKNGSAYKIVETFSIEMDNGESAGTVSFDYLPAVVKDSVAELKNFITQGKLADGTLQYIRIDNLTINIQKQINIGKDTTPPQLAEIKEALK